LLSVLERPGPLVILPHDNPDPDSLAAALGLRCIFEREGLHPVIAFGGIIGRAENRALVRELNIPLVPISDLPMSSADTIIAMVDTQPGRRNNSLPDGPRRPSSSIIIRSTRPKAFPSPTCATATVRRRRSSPNT
jgi:nanoRNase/pAp phosphatase (c-di-AMP/oligoRNAs hydrolase)